MLNCVASMGRQHGELTGMKLRARGWFPTMEGERVLVTTVRVATAESSPEPYAEQIGAGKKVRARGRVATGK
jgi:hypothetical protein